MHVKLINEGLQKTYAIIFDIGDECISLLEQFAREKKLSNLTKRHDDQSGLALIDLKM